MEANCMATRRWRRAGRSRIARIAVTLAIPLAIALVLGIVIAVSDKLSTTATPAAFGASPSASASDPSSTSTATTTAANVNCDIIVPANPLSARGLATPYQLTGPDGMSPDQSGCTMANATNLGAFVQATILKKQTGQLYVYHPLAITKGTPPAVNPVVPRLPRHYIATIDFGFNGTDLTQVPATPGALRSGLCVNGQQDSVFG